MRDIALNNGSGARSHHVSVLKRGNSIIRVVPNLKKSHPDAIHRKPSGYTCRSIHSEHNALLQARPGDILYVARFHVNGNLTMSKPCPECEDKLRKAKLKKVYFTNREGQWERLKL